MTSDPLGLLRPVPRRRVWLMPALVVALVLLGGGGTFALVRYVLLPDPVRPQAVATTPAATTQAATVVRLPPALSCTFAAPAATDLANLVNAYFDDRKVNHAALLKASTELSRAALMRPAEPIEQPLVDLSTIALELAANGEGATGVPFNSVTYYGSLKKIVDFCTPYGS